MEVGGIPRDLRSLSKDLEMKRRELLRELPILVRGTSLEEQWHALQSAQALKPVIPYQLCGLQRVP